MTTTILYNNSNLSFKDINTDNSGIIISAITTNSVYNSIDSGLNWTIKFSDNIANLINISINNNGNVQGICNDGRYNESNGLYYTLNNYLSTIDKLNYGAGWICVKVSNDGNYIYGCVWTGGTLWIIKTNTSPITITNYQGPPIGGPSGINWLATNENGQYIILLRYNTYFITTNYGTSSDTWVTYNFPDNISPLKVEMSGNAQYLTIIVPYNGIWHSKNYGISWFKSNASPLAWNCLYIELSGQYQIASTSSLIYYSNNYGVYWHLINLNIPITNITGIVSSDINENNIQIYCCTSTGYIYQIIINIYIENTNYLINTPTMGIKDLSEIFLPIISSININPLTNYKISSNQDLSEIFERLTTKQLSYNTNLIVKNYNNTGINKDLSEIFQSL
jgi:hypothetical protein